MARVASEGSTYLTVEQGACGNMPYVRHLSIHIEGKHTGTTLRAVRAQVM
jgi:hypothetical protein